MLTNARVLPALLAILALTPGCSVLSDLKGVKVPTAELMQVDLLDAPSTRQAVAWSCYEWLDATSCQLAGFDNRPSRSQMEFAFDLVFDLTNENTDLPIPLVELLLGITVVKDTNLGAVCISFCDPDSEDCSAETNAEDGCTVDDETTDVTEPSDLIPTVDDLVDIAHDVVTGDSDEDNDSFRTIPPGETVSSHITFNLQPETVFGLMEDLLVDAATDYISGDAVALDVPYTVDGSVFFDVPTLGEYALDFGPFSDSFPIE